MPDTDPVHPARDPAAAVVRANVLMRLLGEDEGPTKIGRFTLLERVAEGGMGVVFAAYDPELDRKVALKILRRDKTDDSVRKRIVREAQAMAKLSHPNVAQIYEVGAHDGGVFIAMEFVRGETLRVWQKEPRDWREILATYVQAGRGLAAAHAAGLVHRDFKPDNAIVGRDGRVRVLDFGLARAGEIETTGEIETQTVLPAPHDDALATPLTHDGSIMGTPAYMAPEQFLGEEVTARSDQFALCVSLWEGLYGERPFAGSTRADLIANVTRGRMREVPKQSRVPAWVREVLMRGLAVGPSERFTTTDALLAALQNDPSRRYRRIALAGASIVVVALGVAGVDGYRRYDRAVKISACEDASASIEDVWNDASKALLHDALVATGVSYAKSSYEHAAPFIDAHVASWREIYASQCVATQVEGTWSEDLWAASQDCLEERRGEVAALVEVLTEQADATAVQRTVAAAAGLERLEPCKDDAWLSRHPPRGGDAAQVAAVRRRMWQADGLSAAGKYDEALALAPEIVAEAAHLGDALHGSALLLAGNIAQLAGAYDESERLLGEAFDLTLASGRYDDALAAATAMVFTVGYRKARHDEGLWWGRVAGGLVASLGQGGALVSGDLDFSLANVHAARGSYDEAQRLSERALEIWKRALGTDHPRVASSLNTLANVHTARGSYDEAQLLYERALAISERALGADHPTVATALNNLGNVHDARGSYDEALPLYEHALAIAERALGRDHPNVAMALTSLANVHLGRGSYDEALPLYERALAIRERALGTDHPDIAGSLGNLGNIHHKRGSYDEAQRLHERALAIFERALGTDHPNVALCLYNLGRVHLARGSYDEAQPLYERALAIAERALGPDHPDVANSLGELASVHTARGSHDEAQRLYERALAIHEQTSGPDQTLVADSLHNLANVHVARGSFAEAQRLYERALAIEIRVSGPDNREVAYPLVGLAHVALATGHPDQARGHAERALDLLTRARAPTDEVAAAQLELAKALWTTGDRPRARELARAARDALRAAGAPRQPALAEAETWLTAHGGAPE